LHHLAFSAGEKRVIEIGSTSWRSYRLAILLACGVGAAAGGAAETVAGAAAQLMPVVGEDRHVLVREGQTLLDIAFERRLGFDPVTRLNPDVDPWIPDPGSIVQLPTRYVLPAVEPVGLVINLPEMRLYDFTSDPVKVFAVAIGDIEDPSILGDFRIGNKRIDPAWRVPRSILEERPHLPEIVAPGGENPLGSRWMTIGNTSYGVHGTNIRWSIGRMATHGCVRLYEDEIQGLYERVPSGTRIQLVYQPFKWGRDDGQILLEAHQDVYERRPDRLAEALAIPRELGILHRIDLEKAWAVVDEARGTPVVVGQLPGPVRTPPTWRPTW
jgi:L,D-transpeptidase ErfK/SrfK